MGEAGLMNALYEVGITMNDSTPDYVVIGEPKSYNYEMIIKAVKLIQNGAKLVATNSDLTGPTEMALFRPAALLLRRLNWQLAKAPTL